MDDKKGWRSGLRQSDKYQADLPKTVALETNVLAVPTFCLSSASTSKRDKITHSWTSGDTKAEFTFTRTDDNVPFPQTEHAQIFDVLLAMFSRNFSDDGVLHFRLSDVLRNSGRKENSGGGRLTVRETIRRYTYAHAVWTYSFIGREDCWAGSLIVSSSLFNLKTRKRNPRNSKHQEDWHTVSFHPYIVQSLKEGQVRVFLAEALKNNLPSDCYVLYRYLKRFSDRTEIKRSYSQVASALSYVDRPSRFKKWLNEKLTNLKNRGLVDTFQSFDDWIQVKLADNNQARLVLTRQTIDELLQPSSPN
jgi:hypothetical protein